CDRSLLLRAGVTLCLPHSCLLLFCLFSPPTPFFVASLFHLSLPHTSLSPSLSFSLSLVLSLPLSSLSLSPSLSLSLSVYPSICFPFCHCLCLLYIAGQKPYIS